MPHPRFCLLPCLFTWLAAAAASAAIVAPSWPIGDGQARRSTHYAVYMRVGSEPEVELDVIMSEAIPEGDWREEELTGRTFSFVKVSRDMQGPTPFFRVVKLDGEAATGVEIQPRRLAQRPKLFDGREVRNLAVANNPYPGVMSVNFLAPDNTTAPSGWIKHMLMIFVDPLETDAPAPDGAGVTVYAPDLAPAAVAAADTLYFPAGYHNLRAYTGGAGGPIDDGILTLRSGQAVYLAPGAYVHGLIDTADRQNDTGQRVYGRGILSGRLHPWYNQPGYAGPRYQEIVRLGQDARLDGIMVMESPAHGIVTGNRATLSDFQLLGWHSNNDGVRCNPNSTVRRAFLRAVDDHFYNFALTVERCVLWAGHNGAILTYGWGGTAESNTYNSGASTLEDIDIIHPEWRNLGNNNGLVAAQTGLDYAPHDYGTAAGTRTTLRNIRVDGSIPCLVNLKPRSTGGGDITAIPVAASAVGHLGDLTLDDLRVDGSSGRGRLRGVSPASTAGTGTYYVQDVTFHNVLVGGTLLTAANAGNFIEIDAATTRDLAFTRSTPPEPSFFSVSKDPYIDWGLLFWGHATAARTGYDLQRRDVLAGGPWINLPVDDPFDPLIFDENIGRPNAAAVYRYRIRTRRADDVSAWREAWSDVAVGPQPLAPTRLSNLSCRLEVGAGQTVIPGFVLTGTGSARILVRAVGPTLGDYGLDGVMPDPAFTLYEDDTPVAQSDDWSGAEVSEAAGTTGAFPLAAGSADAALVATVYPGKRYSVHVQGKPAAGADGGGLAIIEVYVLPEADPTCWLANASILAPSRPGNGVLIFGFVLEGERQLELLVRGVGPSLDDFGVSGTLADPRLRVFRGQGTVMTDNDWAADSGLGAAFNTLGAFALPAGSRDAALGAGLLPGSYTVHADGADGGEGNTLIELYLLR